MRDTARYPPAMDQQASRSATVRELMRPATTTTDRHASLATAAYRMRLAGDTALIVTTADSHTPIGIVTVTDIADAVAIGKDLDDARVEELVGPDPVTARAGASVEEAVRIMLVTRIRHLPIVDDGGRLLGIVDITEVCRTLLAEVRTLQR